MNSEKIIDNVLPPVNIKIVDFPGIVVNDEKALQYLGGLPSIRKSFAQNAPLQLNFKPDIKFSKHVKSSITETTSIVIKTVKYRNKKTGEEKVIPQVVGPVYSIYKFKTLFDIDYCPYEFTDKGISTFYNKLIVDQPLESLDDFIARDVPLHVPAYTFCRSETPFSYRFAPRFRTELYIELEENTQEAPYHRKDRKSYAIFVTFKDPTPKEPLAKALERIPSLLMQKQLEKIIELFKSRPIWSRSALVHHIPNVSHNKLKSILPCCAYFMPGGPWSRLWIRFDYDPRLNPEARVYQTVDVRIKPSVKMNFLFKEAKSFKNGYCPMAYDGFESDEEEEELEEKSSKHQENLSEKRFRFSRTSWPIAKQVHYQLIDIELEEVKEIISKPPARKVCDAVNGWLPSDHQNKVRSIIMTKLKEWIIEENSTKE